MHQREPRKRSNLLEMKDNDGISLRRPWPCRLQPGGRRRAEARRIAVRREEPPVSAGSRCDEREGMCWRLSQPPIARAGGPSSPGAECCHPCAALTVNLGHGRPPAPHDFPTSVPISDIRKKEEQRLDGRSRASDAAQIAGKPLNWRYIHWPDAVRTRASPGSRLRWHFSCFLVFPVRSFGTANESSIAEPVIRSQEQTL
jgi:hypothetical protein